MNLQEQIKELDEKSEIIAENSKVFEDFTVALQKSEMPFSDLVSYVLHSFVASRLNSNPKLLQKAKANLKKWLKENPNTNAWLEWKKILDDKKLKEISTIITSENDEGQRLRSSSPFSGVLTKEERRKIIRLCEKARPV